MSSSSIPGVEDSSESAEISFALGLLRQTRHSINQIEGNNPERLEQRAREMCEDNSDYHQSDHYPVLTGMLSADLDQNRNVAERSGEKLERVIEILEEIEEREA